MTDQLKTPMSLEPRTLSDNIEVRQMQKEINDGIALLNKLDSQIVTFTEQEFDKFMILYTPKSKEELEDIRIDTVKAHQYNELSMELMKLVGPYKPFVVKFKTQDREVAIPFPSLLAKHNAVSPEDAIVMDAFQNFKMSNHPLHRDRADADLRRSIANAQDYSDLANQRELFVKLSMNLDNEKSKLLQPEIKSTDKKESVPENSVIGNMTNWDWDDE